jgi:hypothetical protein
MRTVILTLALGAITLPGAFADTVAAGKASATSATAHRTGTAQTRTYTGSHTGVVTGSANRIVAVPGSTTSSSGSANGMVSGSIGSANRMVMGSSGSIARTSRTGMKTNTIKPHPAQPMREK